MNIDEKYKKLLYWFKEISKVPRNSTQEEKIAEFLCEFAKKRNLEYKIDELYNVLIKKPASKGLENKKAIIMQAHTDMVCEKESNCAHNFEKDGIEIIETQETYTAKNTTLGADDGIGVATLLLLLDDDEIMHPDLYCLFTTQEEIGMEGAKNFDYSKINAYYLINVDGEEENTAIVGCAGGVSLCYNKIFKLEKTCEKTYNLKVSGLYGGHSGVDIDKGRLNSNYLTAQILNKLDDVNIISFVGGNKDNAIPNETNVKFISSSNNIKNVINEVLRNTKISEEDKNISVNVEEIQEENQAITKEESKMIIDLLINLKQGVIEYSKEKDDVVETSGNVGVVRIANGNATIRQLIRSSDDNKKETIKNNNNELAKKYGYSVLEESSYPGWKYKANSAIEKAYIEAYRKTHNMEEPIICAIHAGVECGMIYKNMPHLEMISIGPDITDVHTVNETLYLNSCKKFLQTLIELVNML